MRLCIGNDNIDTSRVQFVEECCKRLFNRHLSGSNTNVFLRNRSNVSDLRLHICIRIAEANQVRDSSFFIEFFSLFPNIGGLANVRSRKEHIAKGPRAAGRITCAIN